VKHKFQADDSAVELTKEVDWSEETPTEDLEGPWKW
jgi:hypothetical protein